MTAPQPEQKPHASEEVGRAPDPPPRWVAVAVTLAAVICLVDFAMILARPLASEELRQTWWNVANIVTLALPALGLWGLAAWRRRAGWLLAALGMTLATLLWSEYTITYWGLPFDLTPARLVSHVVQVGAMLLLSIGLLLARADVNPGLAITTAIGLLGQMLAGNLLVLTATALESLGAARGPSLWSFLCLSFSLYQFVHALPSLLMAGLFWSALHPRSMHGVHWRGVAQGSPARPGEALRTVGVVGGLVLAASLSQRFLESHHQLVRPLAMSCPWAQALTVAIQAAGAGLLGTGLLALRRLHWTYLGAGVAAVVICGSGIVPLVRFLLGDPQASGFSPLEAVPLGMLLALVIATRRRVPRATAWTAGLLLGLSVPLAALSTDGIPSVLWGMESSGSPTAWAGLLLSCRAVLLVSAYALFSLYLAQLQPRVLKQAPAPSSMLSGDDPREPP